MLSCMLASFLAFTATATALPYSFVLDVGSLDGAAIDRPLPTPTTKALSSPTRRPTKTVITPAFTPAWPWNTTTTGIHSTALATCLPTTTVTITLPNSTPCPTTDSACSDDDDDDDEDVVFNKAGENFLADDEQDAATPFDTSAPEPLAAWPQWFTGATFTLVFYDAITLGLFLWLWLFGYLWWFRRGRWDAEGWLGQERCCGGG